MQIKEIKVNPTDLPIDFFEINVDDFKDGFKVKNRLVTKIDSDENGFIGTTLINEVDLYEKNTTVINCGVGQGKSTACIRLGEIYNRDRNTDGSNKWVIIYAAPYKSIIRDYYERLINIGILPKDIFDYQNLTNDNYNLQYSKPFHIITTNTILGNYGEEAFKQKETKRVYLESIIKNCELKNKKVIIFFDEIHDCIGSFKQKFTYNLWKWKKITHKIFLASATMSPSTKVIIKYLAEITDDNIHLIESERKKITSKQSNLHLCFNDSNPYTGDDEFLYYLLKEEIAKNRNIQILSFSKRLATLFVKGEKLQKKGYAPTKISLLLNKNFKNINLVIEGSGTPFNKIDPCNVGTTFKTGVSIENPNTSYFVILPQSIQNSIFNNEAGIFTDGSSTVIQAVARLRTNLNSEIFIILPTPKKIIREKNNSTHTPQYLSKLLLLNNLKSLIKTNKVAVSYKFNEAETNIYRYYVSILASLKKGKDNFDKTYRETPRNEKRPKVVFPDFWEYIMEDGEKYLAASFDFFGKDLSAFVVWAAFNNQFENTSLKTVKILDTIWLKNGKYIKGLLEIFQKNFGSTDLDYISEKELYENMYYLVTQKLTVICEEKNIDGVIRYLKAEKSKLLKQILISFVKLKKRPDNGFLKLMYPKGQKTKFNKVISPKDLIPSLTTYLELCVSTSNHYLSHMQYELEKNEQDLLLAYKGLYDFIFTYYGRCVLKNRNGAQFVLTKRKIEDLHLFKIAEKQKIIEQLFIIKKLDFVFYNSTYLFLSWVEDLNFSEVKENETLLNKCFMLWLDDCRDIVLNKPITTTSKQTAIFKNKFGLEFNNTGKIYRVEKVLNLEVEYGLNLIYKSNTPELESFTSNNYNERFYK